MAERVRHRDSEEADVEDLQFESGSESEHDDFDGDGDSVDDASIEAASDQDQDDAEEQDDAGQSGAGAAKTGASGTPSPYASLEEEDADLDSDDDLPPGANTVGNIPMQWYADFDHIGYDLEGKKILKATASKDQLDHFLASVDDPNYWRTVKDTRNDREYVLSEDEVAMLKRVQAGQFADGDYDPYEPWTDFFDERHKKLAPFPLVNLPEPKRRFIPSRWEHAKVMKMVRAIREGRIKPLSEKKSEAEARLNPEIQFFDIWGDSDEPLDKNRHGPAHIPAPKVAPPTHYESYNPPVEYLMTKEERAKWDSQDPSDRKLNFVPEKFTTMRHVPAYEAFVRERFSRCLDLYLCPRAVIKRMNVDPESLLPDLPRPDELRPFPDRLSHKFRGHTGMVRSLSVSPTGHWLVSGSDDCTVRLWETATARCVRLWTLRDPVLAVSWSPDRKADVLVVAAGKQILLLDAGVRGSAASDELARRFTDLSTVDAVPARARDQAAAERRAQWIRPTPKQLAQRYLAIVQLQHEPSSIEMHAKGDYLATLAPVDEHNSVVLVHQISKRRSLAPLSRVKGTVEAVKFHPTEPSFFVAQQRIVRQYDLVKKSQVRKLNPGVRWVSCIDVHPGGDNMLLGSYDRRVCWFDLDLSDKPYRTLKYHKLAVRRTVYHSRPDSYPLFASVSDDCTVHVFHGTVYSDLSKNALIVPLKILKAHTPKDHLGVLDCAFHPTQPWLFTAGADGNLCLFTNSR